MRTYYFQCGHQADNSITLTKTGYYSGRQVCPKCHGGFIMAIKCTCVICGGDMGFYGGRAGSKKQFCRKCANKKRQKTKKENIKKGRASGAPAPPRYADCKHYLDLCLPQAAFANKKLCCEGCEEYSSMKLDVTNFIMAAETKASSHGIFSEMDPGMGRIW